jgi:hypothetical protein
MVDRFQRRALKPEARIMARPASGRNTISTIMRRSCSIPPAITSKRSTMGKRIGPRPRSGSRSTCPRRHERPRPSIDS